MPHKASVISSTRRTETPARYISNLRFFDRALAPPITLDDCRLKPLLAKLRYLQPHFLRPWSADCAHNGRRGCPDVLSLRSYRCALQSRSASASYSVQCLLHTPSNDTVEVAPDPFIISRDDITQRTRCSLNHGGPPVQPDSGQSALSICAKDFVHHQIAHGASRGDSTLYSIGSTRSL